MSSPILKRYLALLKELDKTPRKELIQMIHELKEEAYDQFWADEYDKGYQAGQEHE